MVDLFVNDLVLIAGLPLDYFFELLITNLYLILYNFRESFDRT